MMDDRIDSLIASDNDVPDVEETIVPKMPESLWKDIDVPKKCDDAETDSFGPQKSYSS